MLEASDLVVRAFGWQWGDEYCRECVGRHIPGGLLTIQLYEHGLRPLPDEWAPLIAWEADDRAVEQGYEQAAESDGCAPDHCAARLVGCYDDGRPELFCGRCAHIYCAGCGKQLDGEPQALSDVASTGGETSEAHDAMCL